MIIKREYFISLPFNHGYHKIEFQMKQKIYRYSIIYRTGDIHVHKTGKIAYGFLCKNLKEVKYEILKELMNEDFKSL